MSKVFDLINEFYSEGVKFDELGVICKSLEKGTLKQENLVDKGVYPVVNSGRDYYGFYDKYNNEANAFTIASRGEYAGFVKFIDCKFWAGGLCYPYTSKDEEYVLTKFVFYFLKSIEKKNMDMLVARGSIPALNKSDIDKVKIPVPPLEVQREIVRILDCFTLLTAELTARKKQYEFYCNFLLNFDDSVDFKELGKVLVIKNGKDYKNFGTGNIPVYGSGGIMTYIDTFLFNKPSVLIPRKGSLQNLFYLDEPFWNVDTIFYTDINCDIVIPKFVYYFLKTQNLERLNNAGGVPSLTQGVLNKLKIPIPSLPTQRKIVKVLDKFDTLVNSISDGLPREIELRRKQYEYYRDLLLNFKEKSA